MTTVVQIAYLVSITCFVLGTRRLSRVRTSRSGNMLAGIGMLIAVVGTLVERGTIDLVWVAVGLVIGSALSVWMVLRASATAMPEIVARFNGFGGGASALVAMALFWREVLDAAGRGTTVELLGATSAITLVLSVLIGGSTLSGSVMAELKLRGTVQGTPQVPGRWVVMAVLAFGSLIAGCATMYLLEDAELAAVVMVGLLLLSLVVGVLLVIPIGGADMPVVISLLNSLSGVAAAATGFALGQNLLIIVGMLVGAAGLILTQIMCTAMNRSLLNVIAGGYGGGTGDAGDQEYSGVTSSDPEEVAMVLEAARRVVIVPGYGLAAARGQHAVADLVKVLEARSIEVKFGIHPIAGRMPGHMNVVLAEADVPYDHLIEMDEINREFKRTDVVFVVGANDVVNPIARQPGNPISGMPILNVDEAQRVFVIKRSLSPGYAGIKNELFERANTVMLYGDAREVLNALTAEVERSTPVR